MNRRKFMKGAALGVAGAAVIGNPFREPRFVQKHYDELDERGRRDARMGMEPIVYFVAGLAQGSGYRGKRTATVTDQFAYDLMAAVAASTHSVFVPLKSWDVMHPDRKPNYLGELFGVGITMDPDQVDPLIFYTDAGDVWAPRLTAKKAERVPKHLGECVS